MTTAAMIKENGKGTLVMDIKKECSKQLLWRHNTMMTAQRPSNADRNITVKVNALHKSIPIIFLLG